LDGIRLEADAGLERPDRPTLVGSSDDVPVIDIRDVDDVVISGFRFEVSGGSAIRITGNSSGITIDGVECYQPDDDWNPPGLQICATRAGADDQPIVVRNCLVSNPPAGQCVVITGTAQTAQSVRLDGNVFRGRGVHVLLSAPSGTSLNEVTLQRNVFLGGTGLSESSSSGPLTTNGINLDLIEPSPGQEIEINNNTFLDVTYWIGVVFSDCSRPGVRVCNNLILGSRRVEGVQDRVELAAENWLFEANWWEIGPDTDPDASLGGRFAIMKDDIKLLDRQDPNHPDFLVPPPDSPLLTAGCEERGLPGFVGARGPQSRSR
jgi:hypothetical protein